jgi:hypothetical protein
MPTARCPVPGTRAPNGPAAPAHLGRLLDDPSALDGRHVPDMAGSDLLSWSRRSVSHSVEFSFLSGSWAARPCGQPWAVPRLA